MMLENSKAEFASQLESMKKHTANMDISPDKFTTTTISNRVTSHHVTTTPGMGNNMGSSNYFNPEDHHNNFQ